MTCMSIRTVTFQKPFALRGVDELLPAGAYGVVTEEEHREGISSLPYLSKSTLILLDEKLGHTRPTRLLTIDQYELDEAMKRDAAC